MHLSDQWGKLLKDLNIVALGQNTLPFSFQIQMLTYDSPRSRKPACRRGLVSSLAYVHRGPGASAKVSAPGRLLEESAADPSLYVPDMHLLIQRCRGWQPLPRSPCALRGKDALSDTHSLGPGIGLGTRQAQYRRPNLYTTRTAFLDLGKPFWLQCSHL